jgi:predicted small lipoprotein YifL
MDGDMGLDLGVVSGAVIGMVAAILGTLLWHCCCYKGPLEMPPPPRVRVEDQAAAAA